MKQVDIEGWNRKNHFNYFKQLDYPHFSICGNIDITNFKKVVKEKELSFFISFLYVATKALNSIKEFRYRIREDKVVEHEIVDPSFTLMTSKEVFSFCTVKFLDNFEEFIDKTSEEMERVKNCVNLEDEPGRDDLAFVTCIPWVSFTSITHPVHMNPVDSIPRIAWGKFFEENGKVKMPISIQAHHALVDGVHMGQYFTRIQDILDNSEKHL